MATDLGGYLFNNCTKLSSISLPSVVGISTYAFKNCYGITKISLPSLLELGKGTFHSCSNLVSISIPSATNILEYSFAYCKSLSSIDFGNGLPCVARRGNSAFTKGTTSCVIVTPDSLYDAWIADESWASLVPNGFRFMRHREWEFDSSSGVNVASPNGVKEYIEFRVNEILQTQYGLTPIQ